MMMQRGRTSFSIQKIHSIHWMILSIGREGKMSLQPLIQASFYISAITSSYSPIISTSLLAQCSYTKRMHAAPYGGGGHRGLLNVREH